MCSPCGISDLSQFESDRSLDVDHGRDRSLGKPPCAPPQCYTGVSRVRGVRWKMAYRGSSASRS